MDVDLKEPSDVFAAIYAVMGGCWFFGGGYYVLFELCDIFPTFKYCVDLVGSIIDGFFSSLITAPLGILLGFGFFFCFWLCLPIWSIIALSKIIDFIKRK